MDQARNHLYQASAPAAGIKDPNVVMPPAAQSCAKRRALKPSAAKIAYTEGHAQKTRCELFSTLGIITFEIGDFAKPQPNIC